MARLSQLAQEYKNLSWEEKQIYVEGGAAATRAHRAGFPSFGPRVRSTQSADRLSAQLRSMPATDQDRLLPGDVDDAGVVVAAGSALDYTGPGLFLEEYEQLADRLRQERALARKQTDVVDEEAAAALTKLQRTCESEALVANLKEAKHGLLAQAFLKLKATAACLTAFQWFPPIPSVGQARSKSAPGPRSQGP